MKPFQIFSWERPFLSELKDFIFEITAGEPGRALIITPNRRPWRYLSALYKQDRHAGVLPKMLAVNDMVARWSGAIASPPLHSANMLDQVAILLECVGEASKANRALASQFASMDASRFLPWGIRLANILDEFYREGIKPADMANLDGELSAPAAALMETIGDIDRLYRCKLEERQWTTTGLDHFTVQSSLTSIPAYFMPTSERPVVIAGFYILSGSHDRIFKTLWKAGAEICLHTDKGVAIGQKPHWSCAGHSAWIGKWKASVNLWGRLDSTQNGHKTCYHFFSGFDLHSQLEEMTNILNTKSASRTAVILGQNESLMPTLHSLPEKDVNISMGYPLERTPLFRLLEATFKLHENRFGENFFDAEDTLNIIRHPYFNMLTVKNGNGRISVVHEVRKLDYAIRKSGRYWDPGDLQCMKDCSSTADLLLNALWHFFELPKSMNTPAAMAGAIESICGFLVENGESTWKNRLPLDAEVMYRIFNNVLPVLRQNVLASTEFPLTSLHAMFSQLAMQERIPFEADPVEGMQVMGLLESRLLQFDRVLFLDATDDLLPGNPPQDPLMPDSLRSLFGLPDGRRREKTAAYNLHRLCNGAREVFFLWQEGSGNAEFIGGKKIRSRFVEEFIWLEEQANPDLLDIKNGSVQTPAPPLRITAKKAIELPRTQALDAAIDSFWTTPLAITKLDGYLRCPLQFLWSNIMRLDDNDKSLQSEHQLAGTFVHKILEHFYRQTGTHIDRDSILSDHFDERIMQSFATVAEEMRLPALVGYDSYVNLKKTVPVRLREYFTNQPEKLNILAMEKKLDARVEINGEYINFVGKIDRVDERDGRLYVLDYKTGKDLPLNDKALWNDGTFFDNARAACVNGNQFEITDIFKTFRERVQSIQLPAYLLLLAEDDNLTKNHRIGNAAWIQLRKGGREETLFEEGDDSQKAEALKNCKMALWLIQEHMRLNQHFDAEESEACARCGYRNLCFS